MDNTEECVSRVVRALFFCLLSFFDCTWTPASQGSSFLFVSRGNLNLILALLTIKEQHRNDGKDTVALQRFSKVSPQARSSPWFLHQCTAAEVTSPRALDWQPSHQRVSAPRWASACLPLDYTNANTPLVFSLSYYQSLHFYFEPLDKPYCFLGISSFTSL